MSELKQYGKIAITVEGEFNPNKSYERLSIVDYQGLSYLSIVDGTTSLPTDKTQWKLLSVQGEKGDKGDKGDKGEDGKNGIDGVVGEQGPPGENGLDGLDGRDGNNIEFIYKLTLDKDTIPIIADMPSPPDIDDYVPVEYGWKDRAQGISETYKAEWVCIRKKNEQNKWGAWDGPKLWSKYGDKGRDGDGIEYIYTRTKDFTAPQNPTPDDINSNRYQEKGEYEGIEYIPEELGWTDDPIGVDEEYPYEWISKRKEVDEVWGAYTDPSLWAKFGLDGEDGKDGKSVEYIYKLTKNYNIIPDITGMPSENIDDYVPTDYGWTDNPSGIDENNKAEWVCIRKRKEDNTWSNWEGPTLWSNYGEKGKDGDGIEYIYYISNSGIPPLNPTPENIDTNEYQERGEYENIEYVPTDKGWTDDPTGVSEVKQFEWVCSRKYKNSKWGAFSNPSLWSKYGEKGDAGQNGYKPKTLYAVTNSTSSIPALDRTNLNPGSIWGAFPSNYTTDKIVWRIDCTVSYDGTQLITEWEGPALAVGTKGTDAIPPNYKIYIYKNSTTKPDKPTGTSQTPSGWLDYPTSVSGTWWQCIGTVNGLTNEVSEWSEVLQVNGNNGIDGISIEFRFAKNESSINPPSVNINIREPSGWIVEPPNLSTGEYMWMIVAKVNSNNTLNGNWSNPTRISGEQGPQGEQGIKGDTGPAGEPGGIGPQGPSGVTGVSFEVKWCLGTFDSYDGISNPTSSNTTGWLDYIPTVTEQKPYIWSIQGKKVYASVEDTIGTINWGVPFRLSGVNGINGLSGKGIESVIEYYGVSSNSAIEPTNWIESSVPELTSTNRFLWNYEVTRYSDGTNVTTSKRIIGAYGQTGQAGANGENGKDGISISKIEEYYLASALNSGITNNTSGFTTTIQTIGKDKPYLWNYSKIYFTDNTTSTSDAIIIGHFGQDGSNGKKGQVVYPMGIYNNITQYTTTEDKAPYVYDTLDGNYYVLNAIMTWLGTEQGNRSPSEDFALNNGHYWLKIEGFDAVFTKILIASNGLVGAVVFNGDYLFSQTGYDPTNKNAITTEYQNFNSNDVYSENNTFIPIICLNLKTGETSFGRKSIKIDSNGLVYIGDLMIHGGLYRYVNDNNTNIYRTFNIDDNRIEYTSDGDSELPGEGDGTTYGEFLFDRAERRFKIYNLLDLHYNGFCIIGPFVYNNHILNLSEAFEYNENNNILYLGVNSNEKYCNKLKISNLFTIENETITENNLHNDVTLLTFSSTRTYTPTIAQFKDNYIMLNPTSDDLTFQLSLPTSYNKNKIGFYAKLHILNSRLYNIKFKIEIDEESTYHEINLFKKTCITIIYLYVVGVGLQAYIQNF